MRQIETSIEIHAPASVIWEVLVDLPHYRDWNPFITEAEGKLAPGEWLFLRMRRHPGAIQRVQVEVKEVNRHSEIVWVSHGMLPGLAEAEESIRLVPTLQEYTTVFHREKFTGVLSSNAFRTQEASTIRGLTAMNEALKNRAEGLPSGRARLL